MLLEKTLRYIVLAGIFALPFIVFIIAQSLFFPFITGKNFTFRIIVEVITGAWLALALVNAEYRPRRSWILAAFSLFVIVMAIADAQGVNPFKSFWSNFERMDGWVTLAHLLAYIFVAVSVLDTAQLWRRLWMTSLGVSLFISLYGLLQIAGVTAIGQPTGAGLSARIDATFGNPIYLSVYMLFHIFIAALLWVQMWNERPAGKRMPYSILYGAIIAVDTIVLFFSGTRGTMIGLVGGALLSALILVVFARTSRIAWRSAVGIVVGICVLAGAFWSVRDAAWVQNVSFLARLASISVDDPTIRSRFLNMGIAWQGVKERPLLGWGQENYAIVFDKYYDPRMYNQEQWFDRVHDIIFDWLIAGGFLGLLAYLSIFVATIYTIWRKHVFSIPERSILTGLLAGYFFHNLFVFDNVTSYILFATLLSYCVFRERVVHPKPLISGTLPRATLPFVAVAAALLVWGAAWMVNGNALAQNRALLMALMPYPGDTGKNLALFKQSIAYGTYGTQEAREQLAQATSQLAQSSVSADLKQQFFDTAVSEIQKQALAQPLDARFPLFLGVMLDSYGDYADAAKALEAAHNVSPRKQSIIFQMAQNAQVQGDTAKALQLYKTAYDLDPADNDARFYYAAAAITSKQDAIAQELLAPLIPTGEAADPRILSAYVGRGTLAPVVEIWIARIKAHPDDPQAYFTLAAAYYKMGNSQKAIETLQAAAVANPSVQAQVDTLIQQIRSGTVSL